MGKEGTRELQVRELREQRVAESRRMRVQLDKTAEDLIAFADTLKPKSSRPSPRETKPSVVAKPKKPLKLRAAKPKRGRPLAKDKDKTITAVKPWVAADISRATWYRRQSDKAKAALP